MADSTTCAAPTPRLPRKPVHGQTVCDVAGNTWRYDAVTDSWYDRGTLEAPQTVTEDNNGLVTPDVYDRLVALKTATNSAHSLPEELKIKPHTDVYWYLFHSSDKIIRFLPESETDLRIELDRGRLYALLRASSCRGPKGIKGIKGRPGVDGLPIGDEPCVGTSSVEDGGKKHNFSIRVETPLTTDIVIRLGNLVTPDILIVMKLDGAPQLITVDSRLKLDEAATLATIKYDKSISRLTGSFIFLAPRSSGLCIYAHQKGPTGDPGDPGTCFLQTKEQSVTHADARFTSPLIAMRLGSLANQVLTTSANLFGATCVNKLRFNAASADYGGLFTGSSVNGRTLAVQRTLAPCKPMGTFKPTLPVKARPALVLPAWEPRVDCSTVQSGEVTDLNWVPMTGAQSDTVWQNVYGLGSPYYPWHIAIAPAPTDKTDCNPCQGAEANNPPCPGNSPGGGGYDPGGGGGSGGGAGPTYDLRTKVDHIIFICDCVPSETALPANEAVQSTHASQAECERAKAAFCPGDAPAGRSYRWDLRSFIKDNAPPACTCVKSNVPPLPDSQAIISRHNSQAACEAAKAATC